MDQGTVESKYHRLGMVMRVFNIANACYMYVGLLLPCCLCIKLKFFASLMRALKGVEK